MKNWLCVLLIILLAASSLTAYAGIGDETLLRSGENDLFKNDICQIALLGDTLYMRSYDISIYSYDLKGEGVWVKHDFDENIFQDESRYTEMYALVSDGNALYAVMVDQISGEDGSRVDGAYIAKVVVDGETASLQDSVELDWLDMIESYDEYEYSRQIEFPFAQDGKLIFTTYSYSGDGRDLFVYDVETGECNMYYDVVKGLRSACAYKPGSVLLFSFDYSSDKREYEIYSFDLDSEEVTSITKLALDDYRIPEGLAYDANSDILYYVAEGELVALKGFDADKKTKICAIKQEHTDSAPVITSDGYYISCDYQSIVKHNTDPSARASKRLTVVNNYSEAIDNAYYKFTDAHKDAEIVMRSYQSDIITAMMNRTAEIDVYAISVGSQDYKALFERGYMMELSDSEIITNFVNSMYPNLAGMISRDGVAMAVPMYFDCYANCYNPKAFEAAGLTEEDVPTTWLEYFDLLRRLPDILDEDTNVRAFETYYTAVDMRREIFSMLMRDYTMYIQNSGEMKFDTPIMNELLSAFERVDFSSFGLLEDYDDGSNTVYVRQQDSVMFQSYYTLSAYTSRYGRDKAMPLSLASDIQPLIAAEMEVVFVNPFTENRELAIEFVELLAQNADTMLKLHISPENNEPIRNPNYERTLQNYQERINSYRAQMEAADESEKAYYEEMVEEYEQYAVEFEEFGSWTASAESIAAYQRYVPFMEVNRSLGMNEENSEAFYTAWQQYLDGEINKETMLRSIDKKLTMMLLEGN